jgi:glycosyltransferase involved in cell wall biosynthesis
MFVYEKHMLRWLEKNLQNYDIVHCMNVTSLGAVKLKEKFPDVLFVGHINSYVSFCPKGDLMLNGKQECWKNCTWDVFNSCFSNSDEFGKVKNNFFYKYNPVIRKILYYRYKHFEELMLKFDILVAISNYIKARVSKKGFAGKIFVVPNIVEVSRRKKKFSYKLPVRISYLGVLTRGKGVDVLLKSLKGLHDYELNIYGSGPLKDWIIGYSAKNNLNVKLHSFIDEISKIYLNSDLIVFPSVWPEPFGRVAIEAAEFGVPIVASDAGGIKEILPKECLFESMNYAELSKKLSEFISSYKKKKLKFIARISLSQYSGKEVIKKINKIYEK